jgi:hypothetical protein
LNLLPNVEGEWSEDVATRDFIVLDHL